MKFDIYFLGLPWEIFWCYYRWFITSLALENIRKNAIHFKLFWYKIFVHRKSELLNVLVDSFLRSLLTDNSPSPGKVVHTTGVYVPCSFWTVLWVFLRPTRTRKVKVLWNGAYSFSFLSDKTRKSNRLQTSFQRQHFHLSYFKTLSVDPAGVWTLDLPTQQTGALLPVLTKQLQHSRLYNT